MRPIFLSRTWGGWSGEGREGQGKVASVSVFCEKRGAP